MPQPVLCLGLTPALQRILAFDAVLRGEVNRAKIVHSAAAGKAVNTAKVLSLLETSSILCGFNGGSTGRKLLGFLDGTRIVNRMTETRTETRICTTLIESGEVTELVEESAPAAPDEIKTLEQTVLDILPNASALVIAGTLPAWLPADFYVRFVAAAQNAGVPVFIDSHDEPLLKTLPAKPYFVKMNRRELAATGCPAQEFLRRGAVNVLITDGPRGAELHTSTGRQVVLAPPVLDAVVNPIGSGDSATAGLVCSILAGKTSEDACVFALACGAANALSLLPGEFTREQLVSLLKGKAI